MKNLGLTMIALFVCTTVAFAQGNNEKFTKEPFAASTSKLSKYLQLSPSQYEEVAKINEFFIDQQRRSLRSKEQDKKMQQAVYGNLKLMKGALSQEQYRKYVVLLNVTNNNNSRKVMFDALPDSFLASTDK